MKTQGQIYKRFNVVYDNLVEFLNDVPTWIGLGYTFSFWKEGGRAKKSSEPIEISYQKETAVTLGDR